MSTEDQNTTPVDMASLIEQAMNGEALENGEGDTPVTAETDDVKTEPQVEGANKAPEVELTKEPEVDPEQLEGEKVVLAKDGVHTIPYDRLVEARQRASELAQREAEARQQAATYQQQLNEANQRLQQIQETQTNTQHAQNAQLAQQAIDGGVDPEIFGSFDEQDLAKGINTLVNQRVESLLSTKVEQLVSERLAPLEKQHQMSVEDQHFATLYTAHPDLDSVLESSEFGGWIGKQPSFMQAAYQNVLHRGTANEVVELISLYKDQTGLSANPNTVQTTVKQAVEKAQVQVPNSLSDLPAGSPVPTTLDDKLNGLSTTQLMEAMDGMTPEQIEKYVNRNL